MSKKYGVRFMDGTWLDNEANRTNDLSKAWYTDSESLADYIADMHDAVYVELPASAASTSSSGVCVCRRCQTRNEYAVPNQSDGGYVCWGCQRGW